MGEEKGTAVATKWDDLEELYINQRCSLQDIGSIKGCNPENIRYHLIKKNIPRRTAYESQVIYWQKTPSSHYRTWKGGRHKSREGYIFIRCPDHPYVHTNGYVAEHRLVMEKYLGRYLLPWEHIHHIDGIRDHNDISNLELISPENHTLYSQMCANCPIRKEVKLLRRQVKELSNTLQMKLGGKKWQELN